MLRDDVKVLFNKILENLDLKRILLNSFLKDEKSASDLIKNRNDADDEILKIIEHENDLIDEINTADFNISQIKDELLRRYRFDLDQISKRDHDTSKPEIIKYINEVSIQRDMVNEIIELKKQNNRFMETDQKDLKNQINELERMGKFEIIYPKDLQSF